MASAHPTPVRTWREIAEQASRETDTKKLIELVQQLSRALDEQDKKSTLATARG